MAFVGTHRFGHNREHGSVQADMLLEQWLRFLHLLGNRKSTETLGSILSIGNQPTLTVTHFLAQGHTHSNDVTLPNSVTPYEIMGQLHSNSHMRLYWKKIK